MDAVQRAREEKKKELLRELAELMIEEQVEQGVYLETPHFSIVERQAMTLGRELSREALQRGAREVAANCAIVEACPTCGTDCPTEVETRSVTSVDGPVELVEPTAYCPVCRRSFFPATPRCRT